MANRVAINPTEVPVVIDDEGHSIPGLGRHEVDPTSAVVKQALDTGQIIWAETDVETKSKSKGDN